MYSGTDFGPGAYVLRIGLRGVLVPATGLLVWTLVLVGVSARPLGYFVLAVVELVLLATTVSRVCRALRGQVVFAVYRDGVYFRADDNSQAVKVMWSRICAVELFKEHRSHVKYRTGYAASE
jgi:hypothetical protein